MLMESSYCVSPIIITRQSLGKHFPASTQQLKEGRTRNFLLGPYRIKENRRLVITRTSCFMLKQ